MSTASLRTALGDAAAIGATRARFAAVRCPKRALPSPLADGAAAKATTYLPHVHTLVATRRRPFLDDSSLDDALEAAAGADAPRATTLRVAAPDRPGLLASIAASLDALSLSVVGARAGQG